MLIMRTSLLSTEYKKKINEAIGYELDASNTYKHIANQLQGLGWFGSTAFFQKESKDELKHYQIWVDFVNDRGDVADVPMVKAMKDAIPTLRSAFELYYTKEVTLGEFYNDWYMDCDDATIHQQLLFFVETQRKSIGEAGDLLSTLDRLMGNSSGELLFDQQRGV
jgi:ferritin